MRLTAFVVALAILFTLAVPVLADDPGLRIAPGFRARLIVGPEVANDIYSMTLDSYGRIVVSSRGWVKVLDDDCTKATLIAETPRGGLGLGFDGDDLLFSGDGWLSRYRAGQVSSPEHLAPMAHGEHGGHIPRKGPDGWWYVIGGNDAGFTADRHATLPGGLIPRPEAGALLRFTPDFQKCEVVAHGWRNPYRFDFNGQGDIFVYDSDTERDNFLPWYAPTRVYHAAPGGHHGWRLEGYMRSWCRPGYYFDTVDVLAPLGRGSPTGVVCYRHHRFPGKYRDGVFVLDWTFGKVWFCQLEPDGASYRTQPEVFIEAVGTSGFNPTDAVVAPDGSLLVSFGGRGTRGGIYRIDYIGDEPTPGPDADNDLDRVLTAAQPLDAWSRARWEPLARKLGPGPFLAALLDEKRPDAERVRAVEVLTEVHGGLTPGAARAAAGSPSAAVRARVAWALGRIYERGIGPVLLYLARDEQPRVRVAALTALTARLADIDPDPTQAVLPSCLGHPDQRVVQAAALLAARLPVEVWKQVPPTLRRTPERLGGALAALWRAPADTAPIIDDVLACLAETDAPLPRLHAVRLLQMALGDYCLRQPPAEVYSGYTLQGGFQDRAQLAARVRAAVRPLFPAADERLNMETSRLLAMLEDDDPALIDRIARQWTADSSASRDFHYLIVLARLRGTWDRQLAGRVAEVMLALNRKLRGQEQRDKQNWNMRLGELARDLLKHEPSLGAELLRRPELVHGAHVGLALLLPAELRDRAARLFFEAARADASLEWSGPLVELLSRLPPAEVRPLYRAHWEEYGLRDAILVRLAEHPEEADAGRFRTGLEATSPTVLEACLGALAQLPRDPTPEHWVPLLALLHNLQQEARQGALRKQALSVLNRQAGQTFAVVEKGTQPAELRQSYQPVFAWFRQQHPALAARLDHADGEDPAYWEQVLAQVDWGRGDVARGEKLFRDRACLTCHTSGSRIGPDLAGVATRFARADLFAAIIFPSRDVAPAYRVEAIETAAGRAFTGIVIFYSADGVILQTGATETVRIAAADIVARQPSTRSLMPAGLLKDLKADDLADLYSYLQTLRGP